MLSLPAIQGRFPVGITTFVTPVRPARPIGSAKLRNVRSTRTDQPNHAFFLEEVAFTAYYPAKVNPASKKGVPWFIRPIRESLQGFAGFLGVPSWLLWPVVYLFGALLKIPAYPNAPLLSPTEVLSDHKDASKQWPLVIFSHGLGGSRTAYSQYCSRLAASGRVVLAVEHRDGTGTFCMPRAWKNDRKGEPRTLFYLRETDIHWDEKDTFDTHPLPIRGHQLAFRHHEMHITYDTLCRLMRNDPKLEIDTIDGAPYDMESWTNLGGDSGQPPVRYDDEVVLAGHSFGGCTVLSLLSSEPLEGYSPIPVIRSVILDPWLEPLPSPGPVPLPKEIHSNGIDAVQSMMTSLEGTNLSSNKNNNIDNGSIHPRMLVINSETFTVWKDHFARLQEVVAGWEPQGGRIMTIVGSEHVSFSDFPVLPIIRKKAARPILDTIANLSLAFLDDSLEEALRDVPTRKMEIKIVGVKKDGKPKKKLVGNVGDVIAQ
ncbi:platelet-activating factor acetylhydrolase, isoform II-domain-containing protein [Crassisporium funariophilum]|nr:platelet-activating factor acetylhydrolase, isoform II-domain-containing protein [Crassisporium funariophilum]